MSLLNTASLIVTPNGYKEGTLYSVIPSDGSGDMSVVRATTATRVNSAGLVELVPYNLLTYSEQFNNADWIKYSTTITSNSTTAPNGQTTADTVTDTASGGLVLQTSQVNVNAGTTVTFSQYVKRSNNDWFYLGISRGGATTYGEVVGFFNLATGATGSNVIYSAGVFVGLSIENVGDGWYRCSLTAYVPNAVFYVGYSGSANANGVPFVSSIGDEFYAWGAQLVEGTLPKDYQKTETRLNIPRLDYSNGTCPSLLVEPQRTNIQTYSEDIAQAFPTIVGGTTTANNTTSPSGILNADKYTVDTSTGTHALFNTYVSTNGQSYTTSVFLKRGTGRYFLYRILTNAYEARYGVTIDLETGTILGTNTYGTPTGTSSKIEDYGNGWYRVSLTINGVGILLATLLETSNTATPSLDTYIDYSYTGNGTDTYFIWGLQTEAGSYPTSYIPTTSASVTRNADVVSKTGISSLIGQTEGTLFAEIEVSKLIGIASRYIFHISDGTTNNRIYMAFSGSSSNVLRGRIFNGGTLQCSIDTSTITSTGTYKLALAYKNNDIVFYVNGVQIGVDTSATIPTCSRVDLGQNYANTSQLGDGIKASTLWKTRLTNTQLQTLTSI